MPAPTKEFIRGVLVYQLARSPDAQDPIDSVTGLPNTRKTGANYQRQKFNKTRLEGSRFVATPELPEAMEDLVDALAEAMAEIWRVWQAAQEVSPAGVPPMSNGAGPIVGKGKLFP